MDGGVGTHLAFCALINPRPDQTEFLGCQVRGGDLVVLRRHQRFFLMRGDSEQQTFRAFAWNHRRPGLAALENGLRGFQNQVGLGFGLIVAGEAVVLQDGQDLLFKIDRRGPFALRNGDRRTLVLGGLRLFRRQRERRQRENRDDQSSRAPAIQFQSFLIGHHVRSLSGRRPFGQGRAWFEEIGRIRRKAAAS